MGDDLLRILLAAGVAAESRDALDALERRLRQEYGGTRHYIARTPRRDAPESPTYDATTPSGTSLPDRPS